MRAHMQAHTQESEKERGKKALRHPGNSSSSYTSALQVC